MRQASPFTTLVPALRPVTRGLRRVSRRIGAGALEGLVKLSGSGTPALAALPAQPRSLFVLRNNDIGDLLIVTPLFDALRRRLPEAWIAAGVGSWNLDVLQGNPHLSEVLPIDAPWFNKYSRPQGLAGRLLYLARSPQVADLAGRRFEVGIDVLGSAWGALLMLRAGIPCRLGTSGYAGGQSAWQASVPFDPGLHVGLGALRFAALLGATDLPPCRPQIFLSAEEVESAERRWTMAEKGQRRWRVVVGPGGGLRSRCWPAGDFAALVRGLSRLAGTSILVAGGPRERELVEGVAAASESPATWAARPGLRELFALVSVADLVVCNSSMSMHVAAAFLKRTLVLLGEGFPSARQHQAQWGYPDTCQSLGKEAGGRASLFTAEEALDILRRETPR